MARFFDEHAQRAVCILPRFVAVLRTKLGAEAPAASQLLSFSFGDLPVRQGVEETSQAIADGADRDLDAGDSYKVIIQGDSSAVQGHDRAVRVRAVAWARRQDILETGELKDPEMIAATLDIALE